MRLRIANYCLRLVLVSVFMEPSLQRAYIALPLQVESGTSPHHRRSKLFCIGDLHRLLIRAAAPLQTKQALLGTPAVCCSFLCLLYRRFASPSYTSCCSSPNKAGFAWGTYGVLFFSLSFVSAIYIAFLYELLLLSNKAGFVWGTCGVSLAFL